MTARPPVPVPDCGAGGCRLPVERIVGHQKNLSATTIVSPGCTRSVRSVFNSFFLPSTIADDLDAVGAAAVGDAAGERQRLQHGRALLLQAVGARVLHLAEHVDARRPRHEDRVAVHQPRVLREHAVLELAQVHAHDAALGALLVEAFAPRIRSAAGIVSLVGIGVALVSTVSMRGEPQSAFCFAGGLEQPTSCSWIVDDVTIAWWLIMLVATALVVLLCWPAALSGELSPGELHFLLLSSATGALAVAASGDLVTLLVAMETVSLPAFALVAIRRADRRGAEAALKFFVASVVATAFSLLGISLVYGATGSVLAGPVSASAATGAAVTPVIGVGMVLTVVALAFKVAAVPFQVWVPDTYVGAPVPVAGYLSVVSKAAGLAGLTIVLARFMAAYVDTWTPVVAVSAALTMTVGNLGALRQQHVVRLLAWSSVAQAGLPARPARRRRPRPTT